MAGESEERRQQFLRAAYEIATHKREPTSSVYILEVAKEMGLKDPATDDDVREELTRHARELEEEGDVEGWSSTTSRFKLTHQGVIKAEGG
jgi:hypothetical protein